MPTRRDGLSMKLILGIGISFLLSLSAVADPHSPSTKGQRPKETKTNEVIDVRSHKDLLKYMAADAKDGRIFFIDCWAPWCGPCRAFAPIYKEVAASFPKDKVRFYKVNVDEITEMGSEYNITNIPNVLATDLKDRSKPKSVKVGMMSKEEFSQLVTDHLKNAEESK